MSDSEPSPHRQRRIAILASALIIGLSIGLTWFYFARIESRPLSEDAVLTARMARMAIGVPGRVDVLAVRENDTVSKGDLLFAIDPTIYELQLAQAQAQLLVAEAALGTRERSLGAEKSNVTMAADQIQRARINLEQTTKTLQRLQGLHPKGYVTTQQLEDAQTLQRNAATSLKEAMTQSEIAKTTVGDTDAALALIEQSRAGVAMAEHQLKQTKVYAPNDGRIVGVAIAEGDYIIPAQSAFTLIDTTQWYVSAGFLETKLSSVTPGTCAEVYVAADSKRQLKGVVESIGWGVMSQDEILIPRSLPYVPKTLNWVRVGQRFPVRVLITDPPPELMRAGASATVIVHADEKC